MKSVLLISLGRIGRHMAEKLRALYHEVLAVDRAARDVHAKFLLRNGADDVIYPEKQMAAWVGKTIAELAVRQKHHINVLATKCNGDLEPRPSPAHCFRADETIFILGGNRDAQRFLKL